MRGKEKVVEVDDKKGARRHNDKSGLGGRKGKGEFVRIFFPSFSHRNARDPKSVPCCTA